MLRGVVFDMDGVVIDSHPAHRAAWRTFLDALGKTISDKQLEIILDGGKREEILKHFLGDLSPEQIVEYGKRKDEILRNHGTLLEPMIGVVEFLNQLSDSGVRVALATSAGKHRVFRTLDELGLARHFEIVVTEDAVSGVKAARSAGMRCLGIAHNGRADALRLAGANPIIEDFRSLSFAQVE